MYGSMCAYFDHLEQKKSIYLGKWVYSEQNVNFL